MPRWPRPASEDDDTSAFETFGPNVSGVHTSETSPAPYLEELERANRLVGSIPLDEITTDFQPIVNLLSGATEGYEALPRCGGEGLTEPSDLYARAALEKRVGELGRAIRAIAVRECPGKPLYLQLHPSELRDRFIVQPDDPIFSHDAPLFLELTQPTLSGVAVQVIRELGSRCQVALVIDDFGVGPATLKQLIELEPAAVKLDPELVAGLDQSRRKQAVVRSLVHMCEELNARLIAKGVDCEAEAEAVSACGVVLGQGYVLGERAPLPALSIWPKS